MESPLLTRHWSLSNRRLSPRSCTSLIQLRSWQHQDGWPRPVHSIKRAACSANVYSSSACAVTELERLKWACPRWWLRGELSSFPEKWILVCGLGQEQRNVLRQGIKYVAVLLLAKVKNILCEQGAFVIFNTFWTFVLCLGVMSSSLLFCSVFVLTLRNIGTEQ